MKRERYKRDPQNDTTKIEPLSFVHIGCDAVRCVAAPRVVCVVLSLVNVCWCMRHVAVCCGMLRYVAAKTTQRSVPYSAAPHPTATHPV